MTSTGRRSISVPEHLSRRSSSVPGRSLSLAPMLSRGSGPGGRVDNRIIVNVGGVRYETYKSTLKNLPDTRLSWITETTAQNPDYDPDTREYFFDRHPGVFNMVLNYYRTGKLHTPTDVCGPMFEEELAFWGIDEKQIEPCCWMTYRTHRDAQETLAELEGGDDVIDEDEMGNVAEKFGILEEPEPTLSCWRKWQPRVWSLLEEPYSSKGAQVLAAISILFVLLSIATFTLETHLLFRRPYNSSLQMDPGWTVAEITRYTYPEPAMDYIDYVCVAYFTIEFLLRLVFCPSKLSFFASGLNWVDLVSILPFYIEQVLRAGNTESGVLQFFKTIRLVRIFRIFKLTRHFQGLKILGHTIRASAKEMLLLVMFLVIFILIFACLVYLAESVDEHPENDFKNIPVGLWWACVTMTTLGYGDMFPRTALGYLVGGVCAVAGVLVLALPVPVIVSNFALYYSHAQARLKLPKKRRRILVGAPDMLKTQLIMPGEMITESTEVSSQPRSDEMSTDSDVKSGTGSLNGTDLNSCTSGRISIIFTDETDLSDTSGHVTLPDATEDRHMAGLDNLRYNSEQILSPMFDGGISCDVNQKNLGIDQNMNIPRRIERRKDSVMSQGQLSVCSVDSSTKRRNSLRPVSYMAEIDT